ncbi:MAG: hypothetical protein KF726_25030, partial [Anaerolineae bacterium]|nr:hypothetical protein [Anaerolineae bacterium]
MSIAIGDVMRSHRLVTLATITILVVALIGIVLVSLQPQAANSPESVMQPSTTPHLLGQTPEEVKRFIEDAPETVGGLKLLNFPEQNEPHTPVMVFVNTDSVQYQIMFSFEPSNQGFDEAIDRLKTYATEVKPVGLADETYLFRGASTLAVMRYQNVLLLVPLPPEGYNRPDVKATAIPLTDEELIAVLSDIYLYLAR